MFDSDINANKDRSSLSKNVCSKMENSQWMLILAINRFFPDHDTKTKLDRPQDHVLKEYKIRNKTPSPGLSPKSLDHTLFILCFAK